MNEKVNTGGTVSFVYRENDKPKLRPEQKREIEDAWERHYIKKAKEQKKRRLLLAIILFIILISSLVWRFLVK